MALARVVSFDGVTKERIEEMKRRMGEEQPPGDVPVKEMIMLHDPESERSLVLLFFETDEDYRRGDEMLNAMPTGDTPGRRSSVTRYDVAMRMAV